MKLLFLFSISIISLIALLPSCKSEEIVIQKSIAFYNVENLFDTLDTENKNDEDFLPDGKYAWNSERYNEKLNHINKIVEVLGTPVIMGFCEIENAQVMNDVINYGDLKNKYQLVHFESTDERGIDNALIYDSTLFSFVSKGFIRFSLGENERPTRDILWTKLSYEEDSILCMVNHWPSRSGGEEKTEPKRILAAQAARQFIDSVRTASPEMKIIFMGDLNDHPENQAPSMISEVLTPMIVPASGEFGGSYSHNGQWGILDHLMISPELLNEGRIRIVSASGQILSEDYMTEVYKENIVPFRTYGGNKYLGGYSDHFPVKMAILLKVHQ